MLLLLSLLYVVSITISLFKRLTVEKAITKPVQFKMPARARLPLELRGDEGERKYKMAHLYSWTILSKTNTAFTDYTCNSRVNFCNTTVKSHVSKPINLCKLLVFFVHSSGFASLVFPGRMAIWTIVCFISLL